MTTSTPAFGTAEHISDTCIGIYEALTDIRHEDDHICGINGDLRLVTHLGQNDIAAVRLDTAGIDQGKFVVQPLYVRINTVTCYARCVLYDRNIVSGKTLNRVDFPTFGRPTIATIGLLILILLSVDIVSLFPIHNGSRPGAARLILQYYWCHL